MLSMLDDLALKSWTAQDQWLPKDLVRDLRAWGEESKKAGRFREAGIGAQALKETSVRGDEILWLEPSQGPLIRGIWERFEALRQDLNRELFLGLDHFEIHLAFYPPGRFYQAHIDQKQKAGPLEGQRVISAVLYLNSDWSPEDGGELRILNPRDPAEILEEIRPQGGRLVLFRSDTILHEVRPPRRERWSLTGWFRRR